MEPLDQIAVIGGGSWGTAIALHLARKGFPIKIWVYEKNVADDINTTHENTVFLPGIPLPENIAASTDMSEIIQGISNFVMVVPSNFYRRVAESLSLQLPKHGIKIVSAAKGIEENTLKLMTQILEDVLSPSLHENIASLSGPSFAREVANMKFTAVTIAAKNMETARHFQRIFNTPYFRVYTHHDPIGVQLGGAIKNVIAIAVGIADGMGMGTNARAALITRGLAEISRIGRKMGAHTSTFLGLSGMGDLVLTCTGDLSRNRSVGLKLGKGFKLDEIIHDMKMVAEGIQNTKSAYQLTCKLNVRAPIISGMYQVLYENIPLEEAVERILSSEPRDEFDSPDVP